MCAAAIALFRVRRLVFGAYDPKGGGVDHGPRIFDQPGCARPEVVGGVMERMRRAAAGIFRNSPSSDGPLRSTCQVHERSIIHRSRVGA